MDSNKIPEGVGKRIVEALKHQSDVEIIPIKQEQDDTELTNMSSLEEPEKMPMTELPEQDNSEDGSNDFVPVKDIDTSIDTALNNTLMNFQTQNFSNQAVIEDMDLPQNVAVLSKLITKIPAGVSKQTGALIIKQTMEALGISMTSVLKEAQQVQERLTQSAKECQTNVLEYKKQINILEAQAQKYQKQFGALNDIINLFIQMN